jgi:hypothetical protein
MNLPINEQKCRNFAPKGVYTRAGGGWRFCNWIIAFCKSLASGRGNFFVTFANEASEPVLFMNDEAPFSVKEDGKLFCPYGDYWNAAKRYVQRVDKAAAIAMANDMKSIRGRIKDLFIGYPVYIGHPDIPGSEEKYPDKKSYAWIQNVEAKEDGVEISVDWSEPGKVLLANKHFGWWSPLWLGEELPRENGKRVARPVMLRSIGLTNKPQIGVLRLPNEEQPNEEGNMELLKKLLAALSMPETATEADLEARVKQLAEAEKQLMEEMKKQAAKEPMSEADKTAIANEASTVNCARLMLGILSNAWNGASQKLKALENEMKGLEEKVSSGVVALANERNARSELLVDQAIKEGRVLPANRDKWLTDLQTDFVGKAVALANEKQALKTKPATDGAGKRTAEVNEKQAKIITLVNEKLEEMKWGDARYHDAYMLVKKANPSLFEDQSKKD